MVPDARWAGNLLAVLHLQPSRLAIIVPLWEIGHHCPSLGVWPCLNKLSHSSSHKQLPTDVANCKVMVFGPSPLQWICREWGQKLGCDEMTACFGDERHTESSDPIVPGRGDPSLEDGSAPTPSLSRRSLPPVSRPPSSFFRASSLGGLCCYLFLSSVHSPPTLVSPPCLFSSARPLSHSFWRSVSYCGLHRPVQGSHPHRRGSGC